MSPAAPENLNQGLPCFIILSVSPLCSPSICRISLPLCSCLHDSVRLIAVRHSFGGGAGVDVDAVMVVVVVKVVVVVVSGSLPVVRVDNIDGLLDDDFSQSISYRSAFHTEPSPFLAVLLLSHWHQVVSAPLCQRLTA